MATFFSGANIGYWNSTTNYIYGTLTGNVSRSGNTVTLSGMVLTLSTRYNSYGTDNNYYFTVNGTQTRLYLSASGTSLGSHSLNSTSFSVSTTQTSASVGWYSSDGNSGSFSVTFPSGASAPTGLSVSIVEKYPTGAKFNVSISSYGNPSSANNRYIEAAILNQNTYGSVYRFAVARNTLSSAITVNNSSAGGTLTIQPNKQYYYGAYASNTQLFTSKVQGTFVTLANAPTLSVLTAGDTEASILYSGTSDAGKYEKTLEYSIDGGLTWTTYATISSGDAYSGSFVISGLAKKSTYVLKNRVSTTSGTTDGEDIVVKTSQPSTKDKLYGSVANEANFIVDLYGSVQNTSERITKLYGSNNDSSKLTYQGFGHINYT